VSSFCVQPGFGFEPNGIRNPFQCPSTRPIHPPHTEFKSKCPRSRKHKTLPAQVGQWPGSQSLAVDVTGCMSGSPSDSSKHNSPWLPSSHAVFWRGVAEQKDAQRRTSLVSENMVMRWTTPQHPCCNPVRLVLPKGGVDDVEDSVLQPGYGCGILLAKTCHPPSSMNLVDPS
jgi:hypothetical protein